MARSTSETGAARAAALRKSQQRERVQLSNDITGSQKRISALNQERAPIAKELRQVEAEVGPIKYIAGFVYGATDSTILEKAVTWVIIALIVVFDPLALILLLASQISFQNFRERQIQESTPAYAYDTFEKPIADELVEDQPAYEPDDGPLIDDQIEQIQESVATATTATVIVKDSLFPESRIPEFMTPGPNAIKISGKGPVRSQKAFVRKQSIVPESYVQNEEQQESNLWSATISAEEYARIAEEKRQQTILDYAELVRSKQMSMTDVPEEYRAIVKRQV
jgi:hypothetical protein